MQNLHRVVDSEDVVKVLRENLVLVIGEVLAALELKDKNLAERLRDTLILYAVGTPVKREKEVFGLLAATMEALRILEERPCRSYKLLNHVVAHANLLRRFVGQEIIEHIESLRRYAEAACMEGRL